MNASAPHGNLYCRGFSAAFSEADLLALFGPFGEVTSCRLVTGEQQTAQAAPHAFVRFASPEQASLRAAGDTIGPGDAGLARWERLQAAPPPPALVA